MMLALADGRPAHLTRVHAALTGLPEDDQKRLGVIEDWKNGPHQLTYRQAGHTNRLITRALAKTEPDGAPAGGLQQLCDQLTEASIPAGFKNASTSLAVDWTDVEAWARPVPHAAAGTGADPEAPGDTATSTARSRKERCSTGTTCRAAVMVKDEDGPAVPELARRITVCSSAHDPAAALVRGPGGHGRRRHQRSATSWPTPATPTAFPAPGRSPLRAAGAQLATTCTRNDRGPREPTRARSSATEICTAPQTPQAAAAAGPAAAGRQRRRGRRARPADRRAIALQARAARHRGRRRLPPARLPRGRREDPLPAPARAR